MGSQLQQALRNLCLNSVWKYAVFWKLKHRSSTTLLNWEETYYDNDDYQQSTCLLNFVGNMGCQLSSNHDALGFTVAEMSHHVYSLGEGYGHHDQNFIAMITKIYELWPNDDTKLTVRVVGHVASTGKHLWISTDKFQCFEGWRSQYSAGIKTIAVVAVVPHGVIQLGSLDEIPEDLTIVCKVRESISELQDSFLASQALMALPSHMKSSCLLDQSSKPLIPGTYHDFSHSADRPIDTRGVDFGFATSSYIQNDDHLSHSFQVARGTENNVFGINKCESPGMMKCDITEGDPVEMQQSDAKGQISSLQNLGELSKNMSTTPPKINRSNSRLNDSVIRFENCRMLSSCHSSGIHDSSTHDCDRDMVCVPEVSGVNFHNDLANIKDSFYTFSSGNELSEALGPGFSKQHTHLNWGSADLGTDNEAGMSEGLDASSLLTENSGTEHLLEAVVANPTKYDVDKMNYSSLKSECLLNRQNISEPCSSVGSLSSAGCYSLDHETFNSLNSSGSYADRYSKGFSSTSCSRGSKNSGRSQESGKIHKKRARPGESSRPRPRDRQLIQDRIKELRDLVRNGSKCSIDSLLERTIKHMIFMQSIAKQAENLNKCIKAKEPHLEGSSFTDQGSSWAVEVDNLKACPIIVENINMHGQVLVEMVCNDGSHFLEISEAIRSMGLTILKGVADSYGEKTWIQFLVQDQKNRSLQRMDILWSLIQLLQTKMNI